jgi:hypothetical protein
VVGLGQNLPRRYCRSAKFRLNIDPSFTFSSNTHEADFRAMSSPVRYLLSLYSETY